MKRTARLSLKKETLAALSGDDLSGVVGADASAVTCYSCVSCQSCVPCLIYIEPSLPNTACVPEITFRTICR